MKKSQIEKMIKSDNGTIIDVRTPGEYMGGNVVGSINIPLTEVDLRMDEIRKLPQPLILCCASGTRSGQVHRYLVQQGLECHNGGSWTDVNYQKSLTV